MYKYLHDVSARTVYRVPIEPQITEQKDKRGSRIDWRVTMTYRITRADNELTGHQWKFPTSSHPVQHFDSHYGREGVASYFRMHHEPNGNEITETEYKALHEKYEAEARSRKPGA